MNPDWNCVVARALTLTGTLNLALLERGLGEIIRRHESLRTRIIAVQGVAQQHIETPGEYCLDLACIPVGATEVEVLARGAFAEFADRKVNVTTGPLVNATVLRLTDQHHLLMLSFHRLIADCSSIDQVLRELWQLYGALLRDEPSPLAAQPAQYGDYALAQQKSHPQWLTRHEAYWQANLIGARPIQWRAETAATGTSPATLGRMHGFFGEMLSAQLREFARQARTLSANVMLAVYVAVLWRWCGQRDFVVPFKIAGRHAEHKAVVGYFTHILYLHVRLTGEETFSELLQQVANEFFRALSHQDFGKVATRAPELLAGTCFQWVTRHPDSSSTLAIPTEAVPPALTVEPYSFRDFGEGLTAIPPGMTAVEVTLFDTSKGICAFGVYRDDLFTPDTMARFMDELRVTAQEFVHNPRARVAALPDTRVDAA